MKSKLLFLVAVSILCVFTSHSYAQEKQDSSVIYLYYRSYAGTLDETILFNEMNVTTMKLGSRLQVILYSQGDLQIRSTNMYGGISEINLIIKHGEKYYVEMKAKGFSNSWTGILSQVDEATGEKMFGNQKWPLMKIEEDLDQPFIQPSQK
jgi:hypothetical protein